MWQLLGTALGLLGGSKGGGGGNSKSLKKTYQNIENQIGNLSTNNPYLTQAGDYYNEVMGPGYSAYSQDQLKSDYNNWYQNAEQNIFRPNENRTATRLANSGLSGSGVAAQKWGDLVASENQQAGNYWNSLQQENRQLTNQNRQNAFGMTPSLTASYQNQQTMPLNYWMQYAQMQQGKKNAKDANSAQNAAGWGSLLGNIFK